MTNTTENLLRYKVCKALKCSDYSEASNWCTSTGDTCGWNTKMIFRELEKQGYDLIKTEEHWGCFCDIYGAEEPSKCVYDHKDWSKKDCAVAMKEDINEKEKCKYWQKYFITI